MRIVIGFEKTPNVGIKHFACLEPFIQKNLGELEREDFCRDGFVLSLSCKFCI